MRTLEIWKESFSEKHKETEALYQRYLSEMHSLFDRAAVDFSILPAKHLIQNMAIEIIDTLQQSGIGIMDLFMRSEPKEERYLYSHSVNVTFLSIMLGVWLNYNKSELKELAIAATFHDIGMVNVLDLVVLPRKLDPAERKEIEDHPAQSIEFLRQLQGIDSKVMEAVGSHHKRLISPARALNEYSQIIGLADTFEAMTHPRAYKKAQEPHYVIRKIIEELKSKFNPGIIKALIDNIGIYPAGTLVRLDTKEIGLVIDANAGFPLSPNVNMLFDKDAKRLVEPRIVDLSKQTNIHIIAPLESDIKDRLDIS